MSEVNPASLVPAVAWGGFLLAFVFGFVGNRTNFCTMGAVSDVVNMGDWNRMRMWLLAIAVAIVGANALEFAGVVEALQVHLHDAELHLALVRHRRARSSASA